MLHSLPPTDGQIDGHVVLRENPHLWHAVPAADCGEGISIRMMTHARHMAAGARPLKHEDTGQSRAPLKQMRGQSTLLRAAICLLVVQVRQMPLGD